jgi:hypothetical protein
LHMVGVSISLLKYVCNKIKYGNAGLPSWRQKMFFLIRICDLFLHHSSGFFVRAYVLVAEAVKQYVNLIPYLHFKIIDAI